MLELGAVILLGIYSLILLSLSFQWLRYSSKKSVPATESPPFISVLIAARNEEDRLSGVLDDLIAQNYPDALYEIIVVNDHSEDGTKEVLSNYESVSLIELKESSGKKSAIEEGVQASKGEWIAVTDADCRMGTDWLKYLAASIQPHSELLFGGVLFQRKGLFAHLQNIEQAALTGITASLIRQNRPVMGNAANMMFRKSTFLEVGGYGGNKGQASGDDQFLINAVHKKSPRAIEFVNMPEVLVEAESAHSFSEFINQKIRWASKWKSQTSPWLAVLVWLFYVLYSYLFTYLLVSKSENLTLVFVLKWITDYIFVSAVVRHYKKRSSIWMHLFGQILYPIYVIIIGILANLGFYSWKGRKFKV